MEPHRTVTKEEFEAWTTKIRTPAPGKSIVDTPAEDNKRGEELVGLPAGSLDDSFITVDGDLKACPNCNRQTSFLDILNDGVALHGKDFVKGVFQGERGFVYNPNPPRPHKCFRCQQESPVIVKAYKKSAYICGN